MIRKNSKCKQKLYFSPHICPTESKLLKSVNEIVTLTNDSPHENPLQSSEKDTDNIFHYIVGYEYIYGSLPENTLDKQSGSMNMRDDSDNWKYELSDENEAVIEDQTAQNDDSVKMRVQNMFSPKSEDRDEDINEADF